MKLTPDSYFLNGIVIVEKKNFNSKKYEFPVAAADLKTGQAVCVKTEGKPLAIPTFASSAASVGDANGIVLKTTEAGKPVPVAPFLERDIWDYSDPKSYLFAISK